MPSLTCSSFGYYCLVCITSMYRILSKIFLLLCITALFNCNNINDVFTFIVMICLGMILLLECVLLYFSFEKNIVRRFIVYSSLIIISLIIIICANIELFRYSNEYIYMNEISTCILISEIISGVAMFAMIFANINYYRNKISIFDSAHGYTLYQFAKLQLQINEKYNLKATNVNEETETVTLELIRNNIV